MDAPTRAGQPVRLKGSNVVGITTDSPRKRSATIDVQFVSGNYPVMIGLEDLEVIEFEWKEDAE